MCGSTKWMLLQAKPKVAEKVAGLRDAGSIAKVLRTEAGRARLPCQEEARKERAASTAPPKQVTIVTGKGRATSAGPTQRNKEGGKSKGKAGSGGNKSTEKCPTPRLVPEEWPVPIADSITAVGPVGLVSLRKVPNYERQEEIVISLVCYSKSGPKVCSSHVWLVQAGTTDVVPQFTRKEIQIKPRQPKTLVTGISLWKKEVEEETLAELKERKLHRVRVYVSKICGNLSCERRQRIIRH